MTRKSNAQIGACTGEFADPLRERAYRDSQAAAEVRQIRLIWRLALCFFLLYGLADLVLYERPVAMHLWWLRGLILLVGSLAVALIHSKRGQTLRDPITCVALIIVSLAYVQLVAERVGSMGSSGALLLLVVGIYMFSPGRFLMVLANALICTAAAFLALWFEGVHSLWDYLNYSYLLPANGLAAIVLVRFNRMRRTNYLQRAQLQAEVSTRGRAQRALVALDARNRSLLYNALPIDIAQQLQRDPGCQPARHYPQVTVIFADLVGFTALARQLSAADLLAVLNCLFSRFDELTQRYALEKIKTMGDAYMAVAGLASGADDQQMRAANMALAMQTGCASTAAELKLPLQLRIGMHSGPVAGGVIGRTRYAFDVWGETVNIASRLETAATPGRILVSATTRQGCSNEYLFGPAHTLSLRGCGSVQASTLYSCSTASQLVG